MTTTVPLTSPMTFVAGSRGRRAAVRAAAAHGVAVTGLDAVEVGVEVGVGTGDVVRRTLLVRFVVPPAAPPAVDQWRVTGGDRIRSVRVTDVAVTADPAVLRLTTDHIGDLSWYELRLDDGQTPPRCDPALASVRFTFRPGCGADLDCATPLDPATVADAAALPALDYAAKDYDAFRRVLMDRMAVLQPGWVEDEAADVRTVVVEAMAAAADRLSYLTDAVATEGFLGTARRRISLTRLARLVDYRVDEGCSARVLVQLAVDDVADGPPPGTRLLAAAGQDGSPRLDPFSPEEAEVRRAAHVAFEVRQAPARLAPAHNALSFHTWTGSMPRLPAGATAATLRGHLPLLAPGDLLVLAAAEPGGDRPDPASALRFPVRLTEVSLDVDPVTGQEVTEVGWHRDDGLPAALDLVAASSDQPDVADVAIALGNVVVADQGETVRDATGAPRREALLRQPADERPRPGRPPAFRPVLADGPVARWAPLGDGSARSLVAHPATDVRPAVTLSDGWEVVDDLLAADEADTVAQLETDDSGRAWLRFGDTVNGIGAPADDITLQATYAVGLGLLGNVGVDAVNRLLADEPVLDLATKLVRVSNPLPGAGGRDPESPDRIRLRAPYARLEQRRCVTAEDYAERAAQHPGVQRAFARTRWTGSWHTVLVWVDRIGGSSVADDGFAEDLLGFLEPFRMMGHDLAVRDPEPVPLDLTLRVCPRPGAHWPTVRAALGRLFSAGRLPDGSPALFHPDRLTFGRPVDVGPLLAAAQAVPGVGWVSLADLRVVGTAAPVVVSGGRLLLAPPRVPRLDNDPDFPDRGTFRAELAPPTTAAVS